MIQWSFNWEYYFVHFVIRHILSYRIRLITRYRSDDNSLSDFKYTLSFILTSNFGTEAERSYYFWQFEPKKFLRTVPTIVTAHTFCASRDTRVSCGWCLLIQEYFCAV